ncbi:hypothetical protein CsSME_00011837 [Camellia sinensis var. sinensis]
MSEGRDDEGQRMDSDAEFGGDATAARRDCFQIEGPKCLFVKLCGHEILAASHFLFTFGLVNANKIEFPTLFAILTAKREFKNHKIAF